MLCPMCGKPVVMEDDLLCSGCNERVLSCTCMERPTKGKLVEATAGFDSWALVELMGHQRIAGRVTEAEIGGCKFVRVDVPESGEAPALTKYLGPSSIYAITPMTEETTRGIAKQIEATPLNIWDARALLKETAPVRSLEAGGANVKADPFDGDEEDDGPDEDDPVSWPTPTAKRREL